MNDEILTLLKRRAVAEVPAGFADRVMNAVRRERPPSSNGVLALVLNASAVRLAACLLACLVCLFRMAAVVAVFFPQ